jgi:hypothetical protein
MALTLIESAKVAAGRDEFIQSVIMELYARTSELLTVLPFDSFAGSVYRYTREQTLPTVAGRGLNEAYTEASGTWSMESVTLKPCGGDVDVDLYFIRTMGQGVAERTIDGKVKSLALWLTKQIVKGDSTTDATVFDGIQAQILRATQIVANGGAGLSLTALDNMMDQVDDITHLVMAKTLARRFSAAARLATVGGYVTYDTDTFGRRITQYNMIPIVRVDRDETLTAIMDYDETIGGNTTSVYGISVGPNGCKMLQSAPMSVRSLGEMGDKPVLRTRVEWDVCFAIERELTAARLNGCTDAAIVI